VKKALLVIGCLALVAAVATGISEHVRLTGETMIAAGSENGFAGPDTVAIVPGAAVWAGGVPCPMLEDRVLTAAALFRAGRVARLLLSGNREAGYDEPAAMRKLALAQGVPATAIDIDPEGFTTRATMRRAAARFAVRDAVIVSQAFHLPRALYLAKAAGLSARGVAADRRAYADLGTDRRREFFARIKAWLQEI